MNLNTNKTNSKRFAIALSFPGEYRTFIEKLAEYLNVDISRERILYDDYFESEFSRINLDVYLPNLYRTQSELIVIFLCAEYKKKRWCNLEWRFIKQLISTADQDRIMLLSFGDPGDLTDLGILPGDGYTNIGPRNPDKIAKLILERYRLTEHHINTTSTDIHEMELEVKLKNKLNQQVKIKQEYHFHGKQRREFFNYFLSEWINSGPSVAILEGISGCGKTQLARDISQKLDFKSILVLPQVELPDTDNELFTDIAEALNDDGIVDLKQEMEMGPNSDLFKVLLRILQKEKILIIIDEFQNLFSDKNTIPPQKWQLLIETLNNSPGITGRLLLISNRFIKTARWNESCVSKKLDGLTDKEAANFLFELLEKMNLVEKIPNERLEEVGHRLGGNLRALKTLVSSLRYDSLEDLISLAPDLFNPGDVDLDPDLVEDFERALIERAIPHMDIDLLTFMRFMAVHTVDHSRKRHLSNLIKVQLHLMHCGRRLSIGFFGKILTVGILFIHLQERLVYHDFAKKKKSGI